jgi:hypothetical protein
MTELFEQGIAEDGADAERILRGSERGPTACVPSPKELWRGGEPPSEFVRHEYLTTRTEQSEAKLLLSQLKRLVGSTLVSAEIKDGVLVVLVARANTRFLKRDAHLIRFSAVPGHVEITKERSHG